MQAHLIYNPHGGQVVIRHELNDVLAFLRGHGWTVNLQETTKPLEATELARQAVAKGAQVVIAAGGDGTINEVANGLVNTDAVLGVLPVGTTNSWAIQMGIPALNPMNPETPVFKMIADLEERIAHPLPVNYYRKIMLDAARILVEGRTVAVDVGEINGRYFLMWAGIGLDAAILGSVTYGEKKALGSWAYILNTISLGSKITSTDICLLIDGKQVRTRSSLVIISNIPLYGGVMAIGSRACVNDGKLDVCIFKGEGFFTFVQHAVKVLAKRHLKDPKVEYHQSGEIQVESTRPLPVQLDGELFCWTPVTIKTLPSALKVIVPGIVPGNLFCPLASN